MVTRGRRYSILKCALCGEPSEHGDIVNSKQPDEGTRYWVGLGCMDSYGGSKGKVSEALDSKFGKEKVEGE